MDLVMSSLQGMFILAPDACEMIYGPDELRQVGERLTLLCGHYKDVDQRGATSGPSA